MKTLKTLDLNDAKKALAAIEKIAEKMSLKLSICIVDSAANIILHERMDDSMLHTIDLSRAKAYTAISMKNTSGIIHKIIKEHKIELSYFDGSAKSGWKGGVPAFNPDDKNNPIGAIGVSGGTQDEDEEIAIAGLRAISYYKELDVKNK
ncbi:MAG: GlcG/HbpS family heme-binding protein [Candidatus Humimicrobiaceae bacterium]